MKTHILLCPLITIKIKRVLTAYQQYPAVLHHNEGSRKFILVHTEVTTGQKTSFHKFPVNTSSYVTSLCSGRNKRRVFFCSSKRKERQKQIRKERQKERMKERRTSTVGFGNNKAGVEGTRTKRLLSVIFLIGKRPPVEQYNTDNC